MNEFHHFKVTQSFLPRTHVPMAMMVTEVVQEGLALAWRPTPEERVQAAAFGERLLAAMNA